MKKLLVISCAVFLVFGLSGLAGAAPVYSTGVTALSGWHDADKTDPSFPGGVDNLMCWAAASANSLMYTGWEGGYTSADAIYAEYKADWSNAVGSPMYAYDWWFTTNTSSSYAFDVPNKNFPTAGRGYYSQADYKDWGTGAGAYGWTTWDRTEGVVEYDIIESIKAYITNPDGRGLTITIKGGPAYSHSLSVWGIDTDSRQLFATDSDDGIDQLVALAYSVVGTRQYYLSGIYSDFYITEAHRLNYNVDGIEPNNGGNGDIPGVPEPATMLLLGTGLLGLALAGRRVSRS